MKALSLSSSPARLLGLYVLVGAWTSSTTAFLVSLPSSSNSIINRSRSSSCIPQQQQLLTRVRASRDQEEKDAAAAFEQEQGEGRKLLPLPRRRHQAASSRG